MKTSNAFRKTFSHRQAGLTLIEVMISLGIFALIVGGALSLFNSASATQTTTQMRADLSALRMATKSLYFGQGGYGTVSINEVLINSNKVPATLLVNGTAPNRVINTNQSGTVVVAGATSQYTITVTQVTSDVCVGLVAGTNGWAAVKIGAAAAITTFPIDPVTASTSCATTNPITVVFTSS